MPRAVPPPERRLTAPGAARVLLAAAALLGALTGALLAGAAPASAHAALTASDPRQGAVLGSAPEQVTLTFSEKVAMSDGAVRVLDPQGKRVDTGKVRDLGRGSTVRVAAPLHPGLPDGTFTVVWKAVSADGHPVGGAFTFSVGAPSKTSAQVPGQEAGGGPVGMLYGIARYLSYGGFVLLVGGSVFVLACRPRAASVRAVQRVVLAGWSALATGTIALLLLRHPYTDSGRLRDVLEPGALPAVLETRTGTALASRLLLLAVAGLFVAVLFGAYARRTATADDDPSADGEVRDLAFGLGIGGSVVAVGLASTWALAEHASAGLQTGVAMPVDVVHLLAVAVWLGGLATLLAALRRGPAVDRTAVRRFSRLAFGSVVVLVLTGAYQSWRQVGSWDALVTTAYGRLLMLKIGSVLVLLGAAWCSRRWTALLGEADDTTGSAAAKRGDAAPDPVPAEEPVTVPADPERAAQLARQRAAVAHARERRERDADPARSGLRRSVLAEVAVAAVLLAVTTLLTGTEPARTEEAARAGAAAAPVEQPVSATVAFDTGGPGGKGTAGIDIEPATAGANTLHIRTTGPGGRPLDAAEIRVSFTLESKGIGPLRVRPTRFEAGHWTATDVQLPTSGTWRMDVTVRTSDIDQVTRTENVKIG
ncbi:copper resistance CopC/CopD family protein [Streptomyces meridianus]|uniref:Copper resistance protein CopC/CopD n=1 Tax=Streptomyces meridianus TaxID=2938945 RepID=A0ABT0X7Q4_9ACTN|nr:copper resistance protein CopC [Streptomyces meridianus]MCM2578560.1 copper resistance protein CopC/CopD [Streptomyces meridianus]